MATRILVITYKLAAKKQTIGVVILVASVDLVTRTVFDVALLHEIYNFDVEQNLAS